MQAAGLGDAELSFTRDEVAEFVTGALHTDVSGDEADRWLRASHGWAAALVLLVVVMLLSFGVRLVMGRGAIAKRQAG